MSTYCVPCTFQALGMYHLIKALQRSNYYTHFTEKETKAQESLNSVRWVTRSVRAPEFEFQHLPQSRCSP